MHSFRRSVASAGFRELGKTRRDDDKSFHVSNCYNIQSSNDFIGVLQTARDLAYNARNHIMLQNPHSAIVIVSQKHITLRNSRSIFPDGHGSCVNIYYSGKLSYVYFYI